MKILWLWRYNSGWNYNHWFHIDFSQKINEKENVELKLYGPNIRRGYSHLKYISYKYNKTLDDIYKEFPFDIIIMDGKSRMFTNAGQDICWLSKDFDAYNKVPKIMIEGDYHNAEEPKWYEDRGINLILHRHLNNWKKADKDLSIKNIWFPCSVDVDLFKPNPTKIRYEAIAFAGGYNLPAYPIRTEAIKILKRLHLIDVKRKRIMNDKYINYLQSYICHLNGSSKYNIDAARMFEIMASGSIPLTDENDKNGLKQLFDKDTYITYKRDYSDLEEKARKIISDKDYRNYIVPRAINCVKERHTHKIRVNQLLDIIKKEFNIS